MMKAYLNKKYLLLFPPEEEVPEQFSSYMFLVMEVCLLAKMLDRVLVLPLICSQPRNNQLAENGELDYSKILLGRRFDKMEKYFNANALRKYVDVITFDKFAKLSKNQLSYLACFGKSYDKGLVNVYDKTFSIDRTEHLSGIQKLFEIKDSFVGISGYQRRRHLAKSSPNWPSDLQEDYWKIRKSLVFRKGLVDKANLFISRRLEGKFLAIHWRRGDRANRSASVEIGKLAEEIASSPEEMKEWLDRFLIFPAKEIMKTYQLKNVFLATNSGTKWHLDYLRAHLPIVQYPPSGNWKKRQEEAIIEQIICSRSDYFFAAPVKYTWCSSFSRWIIDDRIIQNKGSMVSHQQKMHSRANFAASTMKRLDEVFSKFK